jgi:hypothetical protein
MIARSHILGLASAALLLAGVSTATAQEDFAASFADAAWNGETIPEGQHCKLQDGNGATPALNLSGLPEGTVAVHLAFNDESYEPMNNGGHGTIGFNVSPVDGAATIPSVPGATNELPDGAFVAKANATSGDFLSEGYMPPCSGGRGNTYSVLISAVGADDAVLGQKYLGLGKY